LDVYPKPYRPSGGEKQRMFLAMALKKMDMMLHKEQRGVESLFVFDEPTGSLDNCLRDVFLSLLFSRFRQQNLTTLLITHDYSMVSEVARSHHAFADRVSFKELTLQRTGLTLREFEPEAYLGWLEQLKKKSSSQQSASPTRPLICVASGAEVFGQQLIISKDPEAPEPCPLEIFPGTLAYVKAPSGTGKTTLVKMMMGLVRGDRLQLSLDGVALSERTPRRFWQERIWGKKMTMVFQHADEALNPRSTVAETFRGLPSRNRITVEDIRRTLGELFDIELTDDFLNKQVSMLSGGQKQRLNLLRSLFLNTDILILDEPLNGLDFESSTKVLAMLTHKQRMGKGILLISHNEEIFDRLVLKEHVYYLHTQPAKGE
jgi:peptide/nickel transport system ATP-binding protein